MMQSHEAVHGGIKSTCLSCAMSLNSALDPSLTTNGSSGFERGQCCRYKIEEYQEAFKTLIGRSAVGKVCSSAERSDGMSSSVWKICVLLESSENPVFPCPVVPAFTQHTIVSLIRSAMCLIHQVGTLDTMGLQVLLLTGQQSSRL